MKFCLPTVGTKIVLNKAWSFSLYTEYRNGEFGKLLNLTKDSWWNWNVQEEERARLKAIGTRKAKDQAEMTYYGTMPAATIVFPKGTNLTLGRIYVRNGKKGFDSITFWAKGVKSLLFTPYDVNRPAIPAPPTKFAPDKPFTVRFWAKLNEVNGLDFDIVEEPPPPKTEDEDE